MKSCLLCGVGGQGTVLASRIIAAAAMKQGLFVRTAETIGMAQRGGCVVSHVRAGESVPSPMIPPGGADVILGFEPGETVRNLHYLRAGGTVIVCDRAVGAVTASLAGREYRGEEMLAYLRAHVSSLCVLDAVRVCRECGSEKALNMALAGALAASGAFDLSPEDVCAAMRVKVRPQFVEMNEKALKLGAEAIGEQKR